MTELAVELGNHFDFHAVNTDIKSAGVLNYQVILNNSAVPILSRLTNAVRRECLPPISLSAALWTEMLIVLYSISMTVNFC